jgi:hypothetical protein
MLEEARKYKLVPEEIFSERNCTADNGGLAKTLFYDIACQLRIAVAIALVDASNCYDCIMHAIALLIFQSFGVEDTAVLVMLEMMGPRGAHSTASTSTAGRLQDGYVSQI